MSLRLRITVIASLAVAIAIAATSVVIYYVDRHELITQVDSELVQTTRLPQFSGFVAVSPPSIAQQKLRLANLYRSKKIVLPGSLKAVQVSIGPPSPEAVRAATKKFTTQSVKGLQMRVLSYSVGNKGVTVAASLSEVTSNLHRLRVLLVLISFGGIGAAALLGALVSGRAVAPLRRLSDTTERIVATGDLSERIHATGKDEISRLSTQLDELFASLETSLASQRQLIADASHELRTPLSTLRANVELLADPGLLGPEDREGLLRDAREELEAMTTLVAELVELARGEEPDIEPTEVRLDQLVRGVVDRAARRMHGVRFDASLEPSTVVGVPERLERAVANLVDNACKWSPSGGVVDVSLRDGVLEVRDRGPGIADGDLPLVFNRFYRASAARGMPGAGLGLAIVKQIGEAHGGRVTAENAADGGAVFRLVLSPSR
jgi:two-component system, OmpR family, sensor histidine kinase MprB